MDARELRIGNIVTIDNLKHHPLVENIPMEVVGINLLAEGKVSIDLIFLDQSEESIIYPDFSQFIEFIRPIPLTEEWFCWNFNMNYEPDNGDYSKAQVELKYVHQLQNLYFALTGEELELKQQ